eukprot:1036654-Rhodomonas_salina.1
MGHPSLTEVPQSSPAKQREELKELKLHALSKVCPPSNFRLAQAVSGRTETRSKQPPTTIPGTPTAIQVTSPRSCCAMSSADFGDAATRRCAIGAVR